MQLNSSVTENISFRPITDKDREFLHQVYASTREEELAVLNWSKDKREAFLDQQFKVQHSYYQKHFPGARFDIVLVDGSPAGRLYADHRPDEIRLIDFTLLPDFRNRGIGGKLLSDLLEQAAKCGKPVRIHVEKLNRALHLYRRLGFTEAEDAGVYWLMEWAPPADGSSG